MASLKDLFGNVTNEEDNKEKSGEIASGSAGINSGAAPGSASQAVSAPKTQGSGRFTNVQDIQKANQKSQAQLQQRISGNLQGQASNIQNQANQQKNNAQQTVQAAAGSKEAAQQEIDKLKNSGANVSASQIQGLNGQLSSFTPTIDTSKLQDTADQFSKLQRQQQNLGSSAGQLQNLRQLFGGNATSGQLAIDQQLLGGANFNNARKSVLGAGLGVQQAGQEAQKAIGQAEQYKQEATQNAQEAVKGSLGALQGVGSAEQQRLKDTLNKVVGKLQGGTGDVSIDDLKALGINPDQAVGFSNASDVISALDQNKLGSLDYSNFLDKGQFDALRAAQGFTNQGVADENLTRTPGSIDLFNENNLANKRTLDVDGVGTGLDQAAYEKVKGQQLQASADQRTAQNNADFANLDSSNKFGGVSQTGLLSLARENPAQIENVINQANARVNQLKATDTGYGREHDEIQNLVKFLGIAQDAKNRVTQENDDKNNFNGAVKNSSNELYANQNRTLRQLLGV